MSNFDTETQNYSEKSKFFCHKFTFLGFETIQQFKRKTKPEEENKQKHKHNPKQKPQNCWKLNENRTRTRDRAMEEIISRDKTKPVIEDSGS